MLPSRASRCASPKTTIPPVLEALLDEKTSAVYCETIGNPAGNIVDIEAIAAMTHRSMAFP